VLDQVRPDAPEELVEGALRQGRGGADLDQPARRIAGRDLELDLVMGH